MTSSVEIEEPLVRALSDAVVRTWSNLPPDIQHHIFEEAVMSHGEALRHQLAIFLHEKHSRTLDSIKAQAAPEPDSLGG